MVYLPKIKKELKSLCQLEIQILLIKMNLIRLVLNMIMAYGKTKDFVKRIQSDKVLKDRAFKIASDPNYDGYHTGLASMFTSFLIKNLVEVVSLMNKIINWQIIFINQLLENSKTKKRKVYSSLKTIFGVLI